MLLLVICVSLITIFIQTILKRKLKIEVGPVPLRAYSNLDRLIQRIFIIGFVIILAVIYFVLTPADIYILFGFAVLFLSYRTFMEYKYDREEREYLLSFVSTLGLFILFVSSVFYGIQYMEPYKEAEQQIKSFTPESIQQIEIVNYAWDENVRDVLKAMNYKGEATIDDSKLITEILAAFSETELQTRDVSKVNLNNYYRLYFNGDQSIEITVYDKFLTLNTGELTWLNVKGENKVYDLLNDNNIEWHDPEI
ncbi:DUF4181 domain-containing protein [Ornithinibacillus halotolerans]|uniref:DUF4181 domain-containing protein n=1 Tax=Ornithinibacillus halotolerans TaxID=1274357 RepID=A0A916S2Q9_9BACI|nr:DUF4181 domain-containing protein [Ornithinibacillus halotolerans]GGA81245.1 hypothetical protein GCM10008025_25760 [Ornithinibacillus halotolerans]